jgi:hypothetical protein
VPLDPRPFIRVGREIGRQPFRVQLLCCGGFGLFWIAVGLVGHTMVWAVALGVVFLITPFVSLARQRGSS